MLLKAMSERCGNHFGTLIIRMEIYSKHLLEKTGKCEFLKNGRLIRDYNYDESIYQIVKEGKNFRKNKETKKVEYVGE